MAQKDRIEDFIRGLFRGDKRYYSKQEIVAEARKQIKESEGYEWLFEQLPDHRYDQITLTNAVAGILAKTG
jgi:hypothetical protein